MPNAINDFKAKLFADDTNVFVHDKSLHEVESKANICVKALEQWFNCQCFKDLLYVVQSYKM